MPCNIRYIDSFRGKLRSFRTDDGAGVTVEFVLWVPIFLIILAITVDVSLLFLRQANIWYVARDTARQISIHHLDTEVEDTDGNNEAERYAMERANFTGDTPTVDAFVTFNRDVYVEIEVPIEQVGIFGVLQIGSGSNLKATVAQRLEPD